MADDLKEITFAELPAKKGSITLGEEKIEDKENTDTTAPSAEEIAKSRTYYYPLSIRGSNSDFPAKIIFRAYRVEGVNIVNQIAAGIGDIYESITNFTLTGEEESTPTNSGNSEKEDASNVNPLQTRIGNFFEDLGRKSYENPGPGENMGSVTMPLPRDLRYADIMQYETTNLGVVGAALESAIKGRNPFNGISMTGGGLGQATSSIGAQIVARIGGNVAGAAIGGALGGVPGAFIGALSAGDVGEGLEAGVRNATRIVAAPNAKTIFQNVGIRNFNFVFKLIAYSEDEGKQIRDIIKFFREEMYPEVIPLGTTGVPLAYKFPSEFEIEIKNKYGENPAFKITRCYLRDVQISYNSTAFGMYRDGNFVETDIVLSFVEIEALHRGKIRQGY
jgi:hypothetical protein